MKQVTPPNELEEAIKLEEAPNEWTNPFRARARVTCVTCVPPLPGERSCTFADWMAEWKQSVLSPVITTLSPTALHVGKASYKNMGRATLCCF